MTKLTAADLKFISSLVDFVRGPGYVLDFTDRTFRQFFGSQLNIDIEDSKYADLGTSKGKRLRRLFEVEDNATAARVLKALWDYRVSYLAGQTDPVANAQAGYNSLLERLSGPGPQPKSAPPPIREDDFVSLRHYLTGLNDLTPQARGYAFQNFLYKLFDINGFDPRRSFRYTGEEIDGSFVLSGVSYLLEAKWQSQPVGVQMLHGFEGKLIERPPWVRGLFLSYSGFSDDGLIAFGRGKRTICMDGLDLFETLQRSLRFADVLEAKARRAAETGKPFARVRDLF